MCQHWWTIRTFSGLRNLHLFLVAIALIVVILVTHLVYWLGPFEWDLAYYLGIGRILWRGGALLYRDVWDSRLAIYAYHALGYAAFSPERWGTLGVRLGDLVLYAVGASACYALARRLAPWPCALLATVAWVILSRHPHFVLAGGYNEEYVAVCWLVAFWAALASYKRSGFAVVAGVAAFMALAFKQSAVSGLLPLMILTPWRWRVLGWLVLAPCLLASTVVGFYWWHGALDALVDVFFYYPMRHYVTLHPPGWMAAHALWRARQELGDHVMCLALPALGVLALIAQLVRPAHACLRLPAQAGRQVSRRLALVLLIWPVTEAMAIATAESGCDAPHYFVQGFPSLILLAAAGAGSLARLRRPVAIGLLAVFSLPFATPVAQWTTTRWPLARQNAQRVLSGQLPAGPGGPAEQALAGIISAETQADDRVLIWADVTVIGTYWYIDRLPAIRYVAPDVLEKRWATEVAAKLDAAPPALIVIASYRGAMARPWIAEHYDLVGRAGAGNALEIWRRREATGSSGRSS